MVVFGLVKGMPCWHLTGCYRFQTGWSHDDFATPQGLLYLDFAGGNGTEKENFSTLMASSNTVATNGNLRWYWGNAYTQIAKYNTFLENITDLSDGRI